MRTTVTIDDHLLAEAKLMAARTHRTIGSVLEDALRKLIDDQTPVHRAGQKYQLVSFPTGGGISPGVDLNDRDQIEELLNDGKLHVLP